MNSVRDPAGSGLGLRDSPAISRVPGASYRMGGVYTAVYTGGLNLPQYNLRIGKRLLFTAQQVAKRQGISVSRLIRRVLLPYLGNLPLELLFARKLELP